MKLLHKGTVRLETDRLILRRFTPNDANDMFNNWANDGEVTKYLFWTAHKDIKETSRLLKNWRRDYLDKKNYNWAITLKDTNQPIGSIGVVMLNPKILACEVGYCIGKKYWGMGITAEALDAVLDFLFNKVGFNRIQAKHDTRNPNSGKVMQKVGMRFEGTLRQIGLTNDDGFSDCCLYSVLKSEYVRKAK